MFPSDKAAAPAMRVVSQQTVPRDITDKFTQAASSEMPVILFDGLFLMAATDHFFSGRAANGSAGEG